MKKLKVYIMAYARKNLGDDLFLKMLIEKYKDVNFYMNAMDKYKEIFNEYNNITILPFIEENFENRNVNEYDAYVYIGGSIFMEGGKVYNLDKGCNEFIRECKKNQIPFFYVSSNFGPYQTQEYFDLAIDTYKNCTDICFRDEHSYNLFKDIPTVRYAPDLVFSYNIETNEKIKDTIGISLIDLKIRDHLKFKLEHYLKMLSNNIIRYIERGKKIYIFSFCKIECDEEAIEDLLKYIPERYLKNINVVKYNGNIDEYIEIYKSMEYMICARFHSMILSYICNQKFYITSYSKKIDNVIQELGLCEKENFIRLESVEEDTIIKDEMFKIPEKEKINMLRKEASNQFKKIDEWIETMPHT